MQRQQKNEEIENLDTRSAYIHTDFMLNKTAYVKELPRANGQYKLGETAGSSKRTYMAGIAGRIFLNEFFNFLE